MTVACRKNGFPVQCPVCAQCSGRPNGRRKTVARGVVQQVRCLECRHQWTLGIGDSGALFLWPRVHVDSGRLLKAFALMVIGLPMNKVEKLLGIKAETVKNHLELLFEAERWEVLDAILEERFRIPKYYRSEFGRGIVVGRELEESAYRLWAKEFGRLEPADYRSSMRLVARILGRSVNAVTRVLGPRRRRRRTAWAHSTE